jgi:hypothetical protein
VFALPASPASAESFIVNCPDHYYPAPAAGGPTDDRNSNGFICVKGPQGNDHFNVKDDKGVIVPATSWNVTGYGSFLVWYVQDFTFGSLDPAPTDVTDDIGL